MPSCKSPSLRFRVLSGHWMKQHAEYGALTLITVTAIHLAWVTTDPDHHQAVRPGWRARAVGDLYAMGPRCSICREIEIPLVARITVTLLGWFLATPASLPPTSSIRRPLLKAFECNGRLTTVFAIHRTGLIAYRAWRPRPRNNSYNLVLCLPSLRIFPYICRDYLMRSSHRTIIRNKAYSYLDSNMMIRDICEKNCIILMEFNRFYDIYRDNSLYIIYR